MAVPRLRKQWKTSGNRQEGLVSNLPCVEVATAPQCSPSLFCKGILIWQTGHRVAHPLLPETASAFALAVVSIPHFFPPVNWNCMSYRGC